MEDVTDPSEEFRVSSQRGRAGTILKISVENFMCHSSLKTEFSEWVNFITGQNGSMCEETVILYLVHVDLLFNSCKNIILLLFFLENFNLLKCCGRWEERNINFMRCIGHKGYQGQILGTLRAMSLFPFNTTYFSRFFSCSTPE